MTGQYLKAVAESSAAAFLYALNREFPAVYKLEIWTITRLMHLFFEASKGLFCIVLLLFCL